MVQRTWIAATDISPRAQLFEKSPEGRCLFTDVYLETSSTLRAHFSSAASSARTEGPSGAFVVSRTARVPDETWARGSGIVCHRDSNSRGYLCSLAVTYGLLHFEAFKTQKSIGNGIDEELWTSRQRRCVKRRSAVGLRRDDATCRLRIKHQSSTTPARP